MKILLTGNYDPIYNRTSVITEGLKQLQVDFTQLPIHSKQERSSKSFMHAANSADCIFLPSFTHGDVKWVRKLCPNKKIIFDPLISKYLTKVFDYQTISKWSPRALKNWWKDKSSMQHADIVLADTEAHRQYFHSTFNIPLEKIKVLYIGVDTKSFYPIEKKVPAENQMLKIGFYGSFAPLQGIDKIIQAADLLKENKNILFEIVGGGFDEKKVKHLADKIGLTNVIFTPTLPFDQLNLKINEWDICLGIFGDSKKSNLVIPNKIYHYAACKKAVITKKSPAINELFTNEENILTCLNQPQELADAILKLKTDVELREKLSQNIFDLTLRSLKAESIARQFLTYCI